MLIRGTSPLFQLVERVRSLPGADAPLSLPRAADRDGAAGELRLSVAELRRRLGVALRELGRRVDEALPQALARAHEAWDQVDSLTLFDAEIGGELRALRQAARALAAEEDATLRAVGVESRLIIDAAVGLVALVERRMAALVRLRLRSGDTELLPDGRPFVDVGAALAEAARAW
jgi:hypothetical protein